jgi:hypothetical protein
VGEQSCSEGKKKVFNANRPAVARTASEPGNFQVRSAEGIYKAKTGPEFDSESPTGTGLFAYICTYLRYLRQKLLLPFATQFVT